MGNGWYYVRVGTAHGPVSFSELKKLVRDGELVASDLVWQDGITEWVRASLIEALFPRADRLSTPPLPLAEAVGEEVAVPTEGSLPVELRAKAEHNHLQAVFKLNECQAYLRVYGNRLAQAARDGLEFIDAALELDQGASRYWNAKGLLLTDGLGEHQRALDCFKRALELEPDSIVVRQNIRNTEQQERA